MIVFRSGKRLSDSIQPLEYNYLDNEQLRIRIKSLNHINLNTRIYNILVCF